MRAIAICLNPALDLVGRIPNLQVGEVNRVENLGMFAAGKGLMVARVLSDLNVEVIVTGFLGKENEELYLKLFIEKKLEDLFIRVAGSTRINSKITSTSTYAVTDINFQGFTVSLEDWSVFLEIINGFASAEYESVEYVVVSGSLPLGVSTDQFVEMLKLLQAQGKKIILDTSGPALNAALALNPFLVKPNDLELAQYFATAISNSDELLVKGNELVQQGIRNVVISRGEKGALWLTKDFVYSALAPVVKEVVSTVGAGDSMVAGLTYHFLSASKVEDGFKFASAVAADSVTQLNVGIPDKNKIDVLAQKVQIQIIK